MKLWIELCKDATTIFDIGSNTGIYALVAKAVSPLAAVYAFEPVQRVYERLTQNNALNKFNIVCEPMAISNYNGQGVIYDTMDEHILSVTVNKNLLPPSSKSVEVKIPVCKLASYILEKGIKKIDLIKLDIETHEPEALEGLATFLQDFQPVLLIEVLSDEAGIRIEKLVHSLNYLFFDIDENSTVKRVSRIRKSTYYNYLLCPESTAQKLGLTFSK